MVVFVHPCPEEGGENMQFIVNVASLPPISSQGYWQVICPYVSLTIIVPSANSVPPLKIAIANRPIHAIQKNCIVYLFL